MLAISDYPVVALGIRHVGDKGRLQILGFYFFFLINQMSRQHQGADWPETRIPGPCRKPAAQLFSHIAGMWQWRVDRKL